VGVKWFSIRMGDFIKEYLDIVIYKYVEQDIRIERLKKRERKRHGNRIDFGNDMHKIYMDFIEWAKMYETGGMDMRSRKSELAWLDDIKCTIIKLENNNLPEEELEIVSKIIEEKK
jgi:hypothetical protein